MLPYLPSLAHNVHSPFDCFPQEHDTGKLTINGATYDVVDVIKVDPRC